MIGYFLKYQEGASIGDVLAALRIPDNSKTRSVINTQWRRGKIVVNTFDDKDPYEGRAGWTNNSHYQWLIDHNYVEVSLDPEEVFI